MIALRKFLTIIFPQVCVACDREAHYFCRQCQDQIDFLYYQPRFKPLENLVDNTHVLGFFTPPLSTVIKALKYQSLHPIGSILGNLLYQHLPLPTNLDFVTAVPLHPKRFKQRGYNQAKLIAQQLANRLEKPYQPLLLRQRHTQNLASVTNDQERFQLMSNVFALNPNLQINLKRKNILLVDDVVTTGSTLAACATQLHQAGVGKISAVLVAHES
ncbi:MAG: Phosphoribosyltransferase [Candidatus Pacebacteria bacterium GW2011_GWB1_47_8]|nr:MAG: Phosphoribosyltransferase [Candidatus Pacebacteria bacterium GW2011_GWA1_46_10]KKU84098.1 MAG: Phosphoribosyltransferase [Candidatus Pacebacteria bacterium GW2011_GWB1_47_8]HCR81533.1 hypothetical protein [Candidatus Paceibacterota bacterium]